MTDYEISQEPPRDDKGQPIHPEKGYPICAAKKSDRTTPTEHGRERDDVDYCLQRAGWGTDRDVGPCRNHPIKGEQWGESNPNFKDGATSEYFKSKLSERQRDVYDEVRDSMAEDADATQILAEFVTRLMLLGEHSKDAALIREARNWAADFGILETAADQLEVDAQVESEQTHSLGEDEKEILRETLQQKYDSQSDE